MLLNLIGFGTYQIKNQTIIEEAIKMGYNFIDTAELYKNEILVKNAIKNTGLDVFLSTKISRKSIFSNKIKESFYKRLEIFGYIDLILLHSPSDDCKRDWNILCQLYEENKNRVKYIGVSNYDIRNLETLKDCKIKPFCNQIELSPFYTRNELVKYCKTNGIEIVSHTTLTRTYKFNNELIKKIASKYKIKEAQLFLQWALQNEYAVIPRTSSIEHLKENFNSLNETFKINQEDLDELNSLNEDFILTNVYIKE